MAPIDELEVVSLGAQHLEGALSLSKEAGWNQTVEDWTMMLETGQGIGVMGSDTSLVASVLTLPYGAAFGWISMVLVTRSRRKQGLATKLLNLCIEKLEQGGRVPVLDATPDGERVYRPLGFNPHFSLTRWQIAEARDIELTARTQEPVAIDNSRIEQVIELDRTHFGGDRSPIIAQLCERCRGFSFMTEDRTGFVLGRDGRLATQIGPLFASTPEAAIALFNAALAKISGPVFIDAGDHQSALISILQQYNFQEQRPFLRMAKNCKKPFGKMQHLYAMAGPELG